MMGHWDCSVFNEEKELMRKLMIDLLTQHFVVGFFSYTEMTVCRKSIKYLVSECPWYAKKRVFSVHRKFIVLHKNLEALMSVLWNADYSPHQELFFSPFFSIVRESLYTHLIFFSLHCAMYIVQFFYFRLPTSTRDKTTKKSFTNVFIPRLQSINCKFSRCLRLFF